MLRGFLDGEIFADIEGTGPHWLVFLHGWGRSSSDFEVTRKTVKALVAPTQSCVGMASFDLPGFGSSPPPSRAQGASEYAATVARALREISSNQGSAPSFTVVGHSFGGRVAVKLASEHPELALNGLILTGVPLLRRGARAKPPLALRLSKSLASTGIVPESTVERIKQKYGSADYRQASGVMRDVLVRCVNEDYGADLSKIDIPVALVWGREDTAAPLEIAEEALGMLGSGALVVIDGVGHMVPLNEAERLAHEIVGSLGELSR